MITVDGQPCQRDKFRPPTGQGPLRAERERAADDERLNVEAPADGKLERAAPAVVDEADDVPARVGQADPDLDAGGVHRGAEGGEGQGAHRAQVGGGRSHLTRQILGPSGDLARTMLDLHLTPLAPTRRPPHGGTDLQCGYRLALPDGFTVDEDDPLLASFGIVTPRVDSAGREEALQHEDFAPGAPLLLLPAIDGADDEVSVWSADGIRLAGLIDGCAGEQVAAAVVFGLPLQAIVLDEWCSAHSGRRTAIDLLVAPQACVRPTVLDGPVLRPARRERRRLVLIADDRADLALWDPAGEHGPVDAAALGLSDGLLARLAALRAALSAREGDGTISGGLDRLMAGWEQEALAEEGRTLWRRLRAELGRRCEVGYLGPGMTQATWDDAEPSNGCEEDDGIPF